MMALNVYVRRMIGFGDRFFTVLLFIRSWSGGLLFFWFFTIDRTSPGVVGEAFSAMGKDDDMNCSICRRLVRYLVICCKV